ncbi:MAG: exo-alpha-sialidase, partial [Ignavibacteriaceae bacterium]|nr:exo-alpha-sialidase [Ignavibacteriaceae bacterium]
MKKYIQIIISLVLLFSVNILGQYPNILVDNNGSPEEVTIAINPLNPNILAGGANIDHFYRSTNGGLTWIESQLVSNNLGVWGDPVVLFDSSGILYYAHLSNPVSGWWIDRIVVQRSTDNGISWNDGVGVGWNSYPKAQDKEWMAVDHSQSPYRGHIYMTWTEFDDYGSSNPNDSSRIRFSKSTDQGLSWSDAVVISDVSGDCIDSDNTTEGAVPCVGPNGEVYVSWAGPLGIVLDKSFDGGQTWGQDIFVSDMPGGWDYEVSGIYRCNGLP